MQNVEIRAPGQMPVREIGVVTAEIRELCAQARAMAVAYIVEIGRRLYEAKGMLAHGEWGDWLKNEVGFSHSTANNYMKIFDEYGANQMTIFGAVANSQTIGNLPYSKALALLAVPASEREEFAEEVKADELSVKELEKAIKERDEERKRVRMLEKQLKDAEKAKKDIAAAVAKEEALRTQLDEAVEKLKVSEKTAQEMREKLESANESPEVSDEQLAKIKEEATEEIREEIKELRAKLNDAESARADAERAKKAADAEILSLKNKAKLSDADVNAFKVMFEGLQDQLKKCRNQIEKIRQTNPEAADKLSGAIKALGKEMSTNG